MDIEPFRVRSTVVGILAQRLVRVLCKHCKEAYEATPFELEQLGIDPERSRYRAELKIATSYRVPGVDYDPIGWFEPHMPTFYRARGCNHCEHKGFTGRLGIYELLMADDAVGELVLRSSDSQSIKRVAQQRGMNTLRDDGARKVMAGVTTVEEVVAATQEDSVVES
jgi:general secretion pathway protein E